MVSEKLQVPLRQLASCEHCITCPVSLRASAATNPRQGRGGGGGGRSRDFQVPLAPCRWVQLTPVQEAALLPSLRAEISFALQKPSQQKQQQCMTARRDLQEAARRLCCSTLSGKGKGSNGRLETSAATARLAVPLTQILNSRHFLQCLLSYLTWPPSGQKSVLYEDKVWIGQLLCKLLSEIHVLLNKPKSCLAEKLCSNQASQSLME